MGNKKKSTGGATAGRRAPTTRIQHKHHQTTEFWREIQEVPSRPTEATGGPNSEGEGEKGMDRRLPGWRHTNHECTYWDQAESTWCAEGGKGKDNRERIIVVVGNP